MKAKILFAFIGLFTISAYAQHSSPDSLQAYFSNASIKLDGVMNEECWQYAVPITNFTQREQEEGEPATEKTKIAVIYNTNEIYFGIWCFDKDAHLISAQQMARDFRWSSDDNVEIMLSPFNDNRNGYLFVTNPNGALADVWVGDEGQDWNKDWNGVWDVAVDWNENGWFAEIVIPFSTLKFTKDSLQTWGVNFERNIRRKKEQLLWQGWSRLYDVEKISQGGKLTQLQNIKQGSKVELKPYALAGIEWSDSKPKTSTKIGGEVNFDISPTLKLNFTVNTDFAQVESDRRQINLTRYSLYYPEKRQFFLEGRNYYNMNVGGAHLFYSRRIGIDQNREIPIIGGVRLFGKVKRTNIGVMSIQTLEKEDVPSANYSVVQVKQDIFKQSSVGFMLTQKYTSKHYNRVYGGDFTYSTSQFLGKKNLIVGSSMAISETKVFGEDAPGKEEKLAYSIYLSYPNDVIEYDLGFETVEADFNSEMGYTRRKNYQKLYTELQFNPRFKKLPFFRNLILKPIDMSYYINDKTKEVESIFYEWRPFGFVSKSGEFFEINVMHIFDRPTEDFELIDEVVIPAGSYWDNRLELQFSSFRGRKIAAEAAVSIGEFYTGHRQELELYTYFNLNKHLNVGLDWQHNNVQLPGNSFSTEEVGGRIDYAVNPKLQTSVFAQWNNEDEHILLNYRINWIPKIGRYFYFVINQDFSTHNGLKLHRTTVIGKLIWRFAF